MDFEVDRTVELIKNAGARKVALQFPDGLLSHADPLAQTLHERTGAEIVVLADSVYGACCVDDVLTQALGASLLIHYGHSQIVPDSDAPHATIAYVHVTAPAGDPSALAEAAVAALRPHTRVFLCSTAQFLPAAAAAVPALEERGFVAALLPSSGNHLRPGEVLGCTAPTLPASAADYIIYVGDGRFHVEAAALANATVPTYRFDPYTGAFSQQAHDTFAAVASRKRAVERARSAKLVGIAVSMLGRQAHLPAVGKIRALLDARGTPSFVALLANVSPAALDAFGPDVDAWVQVACPRLSIDWGNAFSTPLLTSFEALQAFSPDGAAAAKLIDLFPLDNWAADTHFY